MPHDTTPSSSSVSSSTSSLQFKKPSTTSSSSISSPCTTTLFSDFETCLNVIPSSSSSSSPSSPQAFSSLSSPPHSPPSLSLNDPFKSSSKTFTNMDFPSSSSSSPIHSSPSKNQHDVTSSLMQHNEKDSFVNASSSSFAPNATPLHPNSPKHALSDPSNISHAISTPIAFQHSKPTIISHTNENEPEAEHFLRRVRSLSTRPTATLPFGASTHSYFQPSSPSPPSPPPSHHPALSPTTTPVPITTTTSSTYSEPHERTTPEDPPHAFPSSFTTTTTTTTTTSVPRMRRSSHDELRTQRCFLIDVDETEKLILQQEDTDGDFQITVKDVGPKTMKLGSAASHGIHKYDIRGTYVLSNLLQELALAKEVGRQQIILHESKLTENPVTRLSRMIANHFWSGLTRSIDRKGLQIICQDPKNRSKDQSYKIYVPYDDAIAKAYFLKVMETTTWGLQVHILPPDITPEYVKTLDQHPGILSLGLKKVIDPATSVEMWRGVPFVVPGGRFNEMYGWDSYFEALGLIVDGQYELAKSMVDNFCYQLHHYGKILNANRTYYLTRSQPPFLTDMALSVYQVIGDREWLARVLLFAIKEYYTVWTSAPRFDPPTGLSFYHTTGVGMPPETESTHFLHILEPYVHKRGVSVAEFTQLYNLRAIEEPELDQYFVHDRAVRESGHDTTYRFERKCADLLTVDLNSLLYKYEKDIAFMIQLLHTDVGATTAHFPVSDAWLQSSLLTDVDPLKVDPVDLNLIPPHLFLLNSNQTSVPVPFHRDMPCHWESADVWLTRAERRRCQMTALLWQDTLFYDYDTCQQKRSDYVSATTFWTLWAGVATPNQAEAMVEHALPQLEMLGGLVSGTEASRGVITLDRPNRQWDYPFGWAPHQIMAWRGLTQYGYHHVAQRLAYRWLYTITKAFVDFNGVVPEKFDVVTLNHMLSVEYGNVGIDFKYVPREGFGWMNASYQIGLTYLNAGMKRQLGVVSPPDLVFTIHASKTKQASSSSSSSSSTTTTTTSSSSCSSPNGLTNLSNPEVVTSSTEAHSMEPPRPMLGMVTHH